jgi:parallel beta-helix repeat protein
MILRAGSRFLFILLLSHCLPLFSARCLAETSYYVDSLAGSDANSGTSVKAPWRTVAKVNSAHFAPGDHILFKRGSRWRELLSPASSGEAGNPIVIDAYGTGAAPILTGTNLEPQGSWRLCSGCQRDVWHAEVPTRPNIVVFDGVRGDEKTSIAALSSPGDWYWTSDILYVWCTLNPGSYYLNPGVEAGNRSVVVNLSALAYVTLQNLNLTGANGLSTNGVIYAHMQSRIPPRNLVLNNLTLSNGAGQGIHLEDCTNCVIRESNISSMGNDGICMVTLHTADPVTSGFIVGNTVSASQHNGIATYGCAVGGECQGLAFPNGIFLSGIEISANTVHDNGEGIYLEWTNHSSITSNNVYHNMASGNSNAEGGGIELEGSNNNTIQENLIYSNRGNGIELSNDSGAGTKLTGSSYNVVGYNAVHDNGGHGLFTDAAPTQSNLFKYNLVWNHIAGECFLANGIGHEFYGNVCWNNSTGIDLYTSSTTPLTGHISIKNNIIVKSINRAVHIESGVSVSTLVFDHNNYDFGSGEEFLLFDTTYNLNEWRAATGFDTHSFSANPQFVASTPASPGDFVLQPLSPSVGTGTALGSSLNLGLAPASAWPAGVNTAAQSNAWNIGAFVAP